MNKYFVTSDVHSFYNELTHALNEKGFDKDNPEHKLIICGDIFDRGDHSKELYKFLKSLGDRFIFIRGNHEDLLKNCMEEISTGKYISNYHFSNKTVETICQFAGVNPYDLILRNINVTNKVCAIMQPILEWIDNKSVDYYELGDYIFVHGWVPTINPNLSIFGKEPLRLAPREWWDNQEDYSCKDIWRDARWTNGMQAWKDGCVIPNKTIVCGHWHCSWGWSHIKQERKEFPNKGGDPQNPVWKKSFEPFAENGIIALDSCVAYSGFLNCIVIEGE